MSIASVKTQLAALEATISGIKRGYAQAPRGPIPDSDLPAMLNFAGGASYDRGDDQHPLGATGLVEVREYRLGLLVLPISQGLDLGEAESRVEPLVPVVRDFFEARPQLGQQTGLMHAALLSDSGLARLPWADTEYWGCEFKLRVTEYIMRTYANYE